MFSKTHFYGQLVKGSLKDAIKYLGCFPEQKELYDKYISVFENEKYTIFENDSFLNEILIAYQKYYREVFYIGSNKEDAEENLKAAFTQMFDIKEKDISLEDIEKKYISKAFTSRGFNFMGGTTGGYFGPYIWTNEELKTYSVELPNGITEYTVMLLDGFISNSWLSCISFGETGTGGWTDKNGIINCVKQKYDLAEEEFTVSLLKHEAQHAEDIRKFEGIGSEDLEYRAKLVELIYSEKRELLPKFISQADGSDPKNGHAMAAERIADGFEKKLKTDRAEFNKIPISTVQRTAMILFGESERALNK